jgi:hypothetical protein
MFQKVHLTQLEELINLTDCLDKLFSTKLVLDTTEEFVPTVARIYCDKIKDINTLKIQVIDDKNSDHYAILDPKNVFDEISLKYIEGKFLNEYLRRGATYDRLNLAELNYFNTKKNRTIYIPHRQNIAVHAELHYLKYADADDAFTSNVTSVIDGSQIHNVGAYGAPQMIIADATIPVFPIDKYLGKTVSVNHKETYGKFTGKLRGIEVDITKNNSSVNLVDCFVCEKVVVDPYTEIYDYFHSQGTIIHDLRTDTIYQADVEKVQFSIDTPPKITLKLAESAPCYESVIKEFWSPSKQISADFSKVVVSATCVKCVDGHLIFHIDHTAEFLRTITPRVTMDLGRDYHLEGDHE